MRINIGINNLNNKNGQKNQEDIILEKELDEPKEEIKDQDLDQVEEEDIIVDQALEESNFFFSSKRKYRKRSRSYSNKKSRSNRRRSRSRSEKKS
jgi:hypothetical protein